MDKLIRLTLITVACIAAQACADHPTTAAAPAKPATASAPAATSGTSSPAGPASGAAGVQLVSLNDKTLTQSEVNQLIDQGYKPKQGHDGEVLYCRSEVTLGSRFPKKVCMTGVQIKTAMQDSKDETAIMERNVGNGSGACGSARCN
jgi:hypothetical protein